MVSKHGLKYYASYFDRRQVYVASNRVVFNWDKKEKLLIIWKMLYQEVIEAMHCQVKLMRHCEEGIAELETLFGAKKIKDLDHVIKERLWELHLEGMFSLVCVIDGYYFDFVMVGGKEGEWLEFQSELVQYRPATLSRRQFKTYGEHLDFCIAKLCEHKTES